ncbi:FecCD family ABC transporter permease [Streptomyces griseocarneus]|uniref:FecCD family ABC transporter permease n=1 Tax=Streptomyces griseocarneus TaxID=51201 RepID=UPI00167E4F20|nr:iron ABC transporter permease [Streptomyces griseocarneus]MBZ6474651.1 iron ABC transporter permease [Streptomyces griseocarneus]GHG67032.1 iron-enterobactin transporter permease [Streptomyces griseocarneus]
MTSPTTATAPRATGGALARQRRRTALLSTVAVTLLIALMAVGLGTGEVSVPPLDALRGLAGLGDPGTVMLVQELRAPRVLSAATAGAGLAVAGAILQRVARNPLASPDVVGVTGGASLAAVAVIASGAPAALISPAALGGGLLAAVLLGLLAWRGGFTVSRLVLVGLAVQSGLAAAVNLLIVRFPAELASSALQWTTGSVYGRTWTEVDAGGAVILAGIAAALLGHRQLSVLDLGDDSAGALGLPPKTARLRLLLLAVVLASVAAALTGPVGFVALAVPHITRFLAGPPTAGTLVLTALTGAVLLLGADLAVLHLLPVHGLPVGVLTATLGAPWLLVLMLRHMKPNAGSATR